MYCVLRGHAYVYDIQAIAQIFFPNEKFLLSETAPPVGITAVSSFENGQCKGQVMVDGVLCASHSLMSDAVIPPTAAAPTSLPVVDAKKDAHEIRRKLMMSLFIACKSFTGIRTPWGSLTGIRPSKMVRLMLEAGITPAQAEDILAKKYWTEPEKIQLATEIALTENKILDQQTPNGFSLYIGIPFCPSRCLYCSFTSYPLEKHGERIDAYLEALHKELTAIAAFTRGRFLQSLYIGGGTPTALPTNAFEKLLAMIAKLFATKSVSEYSVEAGRPDTISREKLHLMKSCGVTRISLNPQTLNDETLIRIGRRHSTAEFFKAFDLARAEGFCNINTDIILGLPGETAVHARHTLDGLARLKPANLTVHTLAVKRASQLKENLSAFAPPNMNTLEEMLRQSRHSARAMGMIPYYMYRQKNMLGNFENVGYCQPGLESFYNVLIMEETQDIWGAGAGAVSKFVDRAVNRVERVFNVKSLDHYIDRIDEMIARKQAALHHMG